MTHRQVLEFAGDLAEQCPDAVSFCHHLRHGAIRRFADATDALLQSWSDALSRCQSGGAQGPDRASEIQQVLESIAVCGVLLRVGCTLMDGIARREKIAEAGDLARETIRQFSGFARATLQTVMRRSDLPTTTRNDADRLMKRCERLSDVLCGAMAFYLGHSFAADAARAADFAETFSRFPALVRVPTRQALGWVPIGSGPFDSLTKTLVQALADCCAGGIRPRRRRTDSYTELSEMFRPRVLRLPVSESGDAGRSHTRRVPDPALPTLSFARLFRRKRP